MMTGLLQALNIGPAFADASGYSWSAAPVLDVSKYDWGYSKCPSDDTGCYSLPYPEGSNNPTAGMADPWVYSFRNCTSYAAWKINQVFGVSNISGWGNASTWNTGYTHSQPYTVYSPSNYTPVVGDLAQWGTEVGGGYGHVAYVAAVNNGIATLDEYNSGLPLDNNHHLQWGLFDNSRTTASNSAGTPDHYIHIGTITPPAPPLPLRIGTVTGGSYLVKQSDPSGSWTDEYDGASQGMLSGDVIGVVGGGYFQVKEGAMDAGWTTELSSGAVAGAVSDETGSTPMRIGALESNGHFYVKEGLTGSWTDETPGGGTAAGYLSGSRIGVLMNDGTFNVKDGALDASWTTEGTGISQGILSGSLIGEVTTGGTFNVKQGGLSASWTDEYDGAATGMLSDATSNTALRIGFLDSSGTFKVKVGITGTWSTEGIGDAQGILSGNLIGEFATGGSFYVKQGALDAGWNDEYDGVTGGSLWSL